MTTRERITDLQIEISRLEREPVDSYYTQAEKNRDLDDRRCELCRLLSSL